MNHRARRPARWLPWLLWPLVLFLLLPATTATAHAAVLQIVPADGTLLVVAPTELRITFSEPIQSDFLDVRFLSAADHDLSLDGAVDPTNDRVVVVPLPVLADGLHQIVFVVRDREDLHEVRGRTSFALGNSAVATPSAPPDPGARPLETGARWLFAGGLALLVGLAVVGPRLADQRIDRARRIGALGLGGVVLGRLGVLAARAVDLGEGVGAGLRAVAGTGDMVRLPISLAAAACIVPLALPGRFPALDQPVRANGRTTFRAALAWVGIVWLALVAAWGDHAALLGPVEPAVGLAKAAHLVGLGLWVGVLVVAVVGTVGRDELRQVLDSVGRVAVAGAILTVGTGFLLAGRLVVSLTGLLSTRYGAMLVAKLTIAAVAVILGLVLRARGERRVGATEAGLLVFGAVLLGAAMATAAPATDAAYLPAPATRPALSSSAEVDDVLVRVRAVPAAPGPNALEIAVVQTRRPVPAPVTGVTVQVLEPTGTRQWDAVPDDRGNVDIGDVSLAEGTATMQFVVHRDGLADTTVRADVRTITPRYHAPPVVSSSRLQHWWWTAATAAAVVLGWWLIRTRRRPTHRPM